eukprot:TRINITY_DN32083_c0_g1_i1.p1 TRINITY_DN32083_c0_g1~~TRINITY_DN32083_c0_g1_i1.p1  ORF type:complete len:371 (-),score=113.67 TRINITY_DN32083_c0_g1_i1:96-1208(-)
MVSAIRNTAHSDHIKEIMEYGLSKGCFSDVVISVTGSKKVIRCHKSVLAMSSPFMATLLDSMADPQEQTYITLCDLSFSEAMAMLNLVYVGRVKLSSDKLETTKDAAKTFLNIDVEIEKVEPEKVVKPRKRKVVHQNSKVNSKRPLLMKNSSAHPPIFVVMPAPPAFPSTGGGGVSSTGVAGSDVGTEDLITMNSYQRAKLRCADKFKCDLCGKGFPLSCLLQRHKRTHSNMKPFSCSYCDKSFSSKTSLNHHLFMKHLEDQSKRIDIGKKLIENLKQKSIKNVEIVGAERIKNIEGQVIKADDDYIISDQGGNCANIANLEIIGVEDITQQIAGQMVRREEGEGAEAGQVAETVDNLYYIQAGQAGNYW